MKLSIERPNDFINVLNGDVNYFDFNYLIVSCHGTDDGAISMPALHKDCYLESEPRTNFGPEQIATYNKLANKVIISTGCSTGKNSSMVESSINSHENTFIAPNADPEGTSNLYFIQSFFYNLVDNDIENAFKNLV